MFTYKSGSWFGINISVGSGIGAGIGVGISTGEGIGPYNGKSSDTGYSMMG